MPRLPRAMPPRRRGDRRSARANRRSPRRSRLRSGARRARRSLRRHRAQRDATRMPPTAPDAKQAARQTVDSNAPALVGLSHRIHAHPELKFEETRSSAWTAGVLADAGLAVDAGICDLPTAFSCRIGSGALHIAICAEYDALPGIGHACGHNIIAAMAVGAALALAPLVDELDLTVSVIGTPAEEGGGGKVFLLERGAFAGVDAAMMVHPAPLEDLTPRVSAVAHFGVSYAGHAAHASA